MRWFVKKYITKPLTLSNITDDFIYDGKAPSLIRGHFFTEGMNDGIER